jgi:hypothetical protein
MRSCATFQTGESVLESGWKGNNVKHMFMHAWPIFLRLQLEELFIPLAMNFALTCSKEAEISMLQRLWAFGEADISPPSSGVKLTRWPLCCPSVSGYEK